MAKATASQVLHLFSSDFRALYLQDCLDVLALPDGAVHRFRYDREWVWLNGHDARSPDLSAQWTGLQEAKTPVLVYFLAAKSRRYGGDVHIPLRWGHVVKAFVQGDYLFVDFAVGSYADPLTFKAHEGDMDLAPAKFRTPDPKDRFSEDRAAWATAVTASSRSLLDQRFPAGSKAVVPANGAFSAVLADAPFASGRATDQSAAFERIVSLMDDLVGPKKVNDTVEGSVLAFFRVLAVKEVGGKAETYAKSFYTLRAPKRYQLDVLHLNPAGYGRDSLSFELPDALSPIGSTTVPAAGRYDVVSFQFSVKPKENDTYGEIGISNLAPDGATDRAAISVNLQYKSKPRRAFTRLSWMIAIGTTLAAFAVALNATRAVAVNTPANAAEYVDISCWVNWLIPGAYLAVSGGAIIPAALTAIVAGLVAVGAVFRRRWGLSGGSQ
jgi:hypothetical protein